MATTYNNEIDFFLGNRNVLNITQVHSVSIRAGNDNTILFSGSPDSSLVRTQNIKEFLEGLGYTEVSNIRIIDFPSIFLTLEWSDGTKTNLDGSGESILGTAKPLADVYFDMSALDEINLTFNGTQPGRMVPTQNEHRVDINYDGDAPKIRTGFELGNFFKALGFGINQGYEDESLWNNTPVIESEIAGDPSHTTTTVTLSSNFETTTIIKNQNVTDEKVDELEAKLDRLETLVAQNTINLLNIPLDGDDMTYFIGKVNTNEERLYNRMTSDFPVWLLSMGISIDPRTGRTIYQGQVLSKMKGIAGRASLSTSPRLRDAIEHKETDGSGYFEFDFMATPNTTYYVHVVVDGVGSYTRAVAYNTGE